MFDEKGACNICNQVEYKQTQINWADKKEEFDTLIEQYRGGNDYDCIVPYSGGKDSMWILYYLVKHYKLKPLIVRFDHGFLRPNLDENTKKYKENLVLIFITLRQIGKLFKN